MVNSPCGARLCISFLDRMAALFEEEEESEESNRAFDIGYVALSVIEIFIASETGTFH